jgi:hypothetical protein
LQEDDVIAQVTVASISSVPEKTQRDAGSQTLGQTNVKGQPVKPKPRGPKRRNSKS